MNNKGLPRTFRCHFFLFSIIETRATSTLGSRKKNKKKQASERPENIQSSSLTNDHDPDSLNIGPTSSISHDESIVSQEIAQSTLLSDSQDTPSHSSKEHVDGFPATDVHTVQQADDDGSEDEHQFNAALPTCTTPSIMVIAMNPTFPHPPAVSSDVINGHPVNKRREENTDNVERDQVDSNENPNQNDDVHSGTHEQSSENAQTSESHRRSSRQRKRKRNYSPSDYR